MVSTPLKSMKVNWDDDIFNTWKNNKHVPVTTNQMMKLGAKPFESEKRSALRGAPSPDPSGPRLADLHC